MRIIILAILMSGCANTRIDSPHFKMTTQADVKGLDVKPNGAIHIDELNHSRATLAGGKAIGGGAQAVGSAVAASGILMLAK